MANVKISAAADAGALLSSDMLPLARSGDTNAYHATMAEVATFTTASVASGAYGNVGRNLLHNPLFNVVQRGAGPWTTFGNYTADRWQIMGAAPDTVSTTVGAISDAGRTAIGDEAATVALTTGFTGTSTGVTYLAHKIEGIRRTAGKNVTVSFWAWAGSGTPRIAVNAAQVFGTGGAPSAGIFATAATVTLSTALTRYSVTIAMPSATGKTLGTNGDDYLQLTLFLNGGSNANAGGIGVQSGTISFWGVQLEIGSVATPLEKPDPQQDLAKCQRFYQVGAFSYIGFGNVNSYCGQTLSLPVTMRAPPTVTPTYTNTSNSTAYSVQPTANTGSQLTIGTQVLAGTANAFLVGTFTASADF